MTIKSATERHIQTVAVFIITGVLGWVGFSLNSLIEHQARVDERISYMTSQIIHLQEQLSNQISRRELDSELSHIHREIQRLDNRVEQLERRERD
ncbi:hypothetical protein SAMN05660443_0239 [Marinospirillum celere]|uniref:Uncharacterized protein n=1 Tax=Marinospirillum celere TaxID=1122252 RepID=A0A1I1E6L4_9GAMM|nr:hypothetical protein [Marinospirillum celere]SFB80553.1 hypothetical protein SAMN05660443_0239 [Marinospirillum celere]